MIIINYFKYFTILTEFHVINHNIWMYKLELSTNQ